MPFQPINFRLNQSSPLNELAQGLMRGLQFRQQMDSQGLQDALTKAKTARENKLAEDPFGSKVFPGPGGVAQGLEYLRKTEGEDSEAYQNAKKLYDLDLKRGESRSRYQDLLGSALNKRFSTGLGKHSLEMQEIDQGYLPGSGGKIALTPEEQEVLKGQYKLKKLKDTTDPQTRARALYAANVDKTLDSLNVDDLVQYGGLKGAARLKAHQGLSAKGNAPEEYIKYKKAITAASIFGKQVRQFYGDSITAQIQEKLEIITKPANWVDNPKVAKAAFNTLKDILKKETGTFRGALKDTSEFEAPKKEAKGIIRYKWNSETGGVQ